MKKAIVLLFLLICLWAVPVIAGYYPDIEKEYPAESFLIGIGEVAASGDALKDRTRAEKTLISVFREGFPKHLINPFLKFDINHSFPL